MQLVTKTLNIHNETLNTLLSELQEECQNVISLTHQLQLQDFSDRQRGEILSQLLVSAIHLNSHCDQDLQDLIADEIEKLPD